MCRAITCQKCQRPSWAGCGAHVEQVLGHVPPAERCQCRARGDAGGQGGSGGPGRTAGKGGIGGGIGGVLRSLLGKS